MRNTQIHIGDFETSTGNIDGSTNVYLWGISSLDKKHRYLGTHITDMFDTIKYYEIKTVLFHNLSFDGEFITHWLIDNGYKFVDNNFGKPLEPFTFTRMKTDMSIIYDLQVNIDGHVVKFGDTAKLLLASVDKMGKMLGLPKLEIDYDKYKYFESIHHVPDQLIEYLWRDIDIVIDIYSQFKHTFKNHGITLGSTALKDYKKHIGNWEFAKRFGGYFYNPKTRKQEYNNVLTKEQWNEFKKSYRGGLVVFNEKYIGQHLKNLDGYSCDYNSMYPSVYGSNLFPVGKPYEHYIYGENVLQLHKIYIRKAAIKNDTLPAIIPSNYNVSKFETKYLHTVEDEYYSIWEWELKIWEKFYDLEYRVVKTWWFYGEYIFKSWTDEKKYLKENAKNVVDREYNKGLLNSFYGKHGQNYMRQHRSMVHDPEGTLPGTRYGEYVDTPVTTESDNLSYVPVASAITAYARVELCNAIWENQDIFIYGDTDSIYCTKKPTGVPIHDTNFGCWKYEKRFTEFKFIKPKAYICKLTHEYKNYQWNEADRLHVALAGLPKEKHKDLTFEIFNRGHELPKGKKQKKNVKGGIILVENKYTL